MNKKEFMELQAQLADVVVAYETFCKKGHLLDLRFNYALNELLVKEEYLRYENGLLAGICTMIIDKKGLDKVEAYVKQQREEYAKRIVARTQKVSHAAHILKVMKELPNEIIDLLEDSFKEYVINYHPAVKFISSEDENILYEHLKKFYYENNYSGFKEMLDLNKNLLKKASFDDDEEFQLKVINYYYGIMEEMATDVNKRRTEYPYNIEPIFNDKLSIAAYEGELRALISKLADGNKALHEDLINLYGEDITL